MNLIQFKINPFDSKMSVNQVKIIEIRLNLDKNVSK